MNELQGATLVGTLDLGVEYFRGESGVYMGTTAPESENVNVWIEPDYEASGTVVSKEQVDEMIDSKGYMTEEQVRALVAELMKGEA